MVAFLTSMILCFLIELGGRGQHLSAILADRFRARGRVILAFAAATLLNAAISSAAGVLVHDMIADRPLQLFQALAILFAAAAMLIPARRLDRLDHWRIGTFTTCFLGVFILQFGDSSQFLIMATSAREGAPIFAALGGAVGVGASIAMGMLLGEDAWARLPLRWVRLGLGMALLLWAIIQGLGAMQLIGGAS
jgi:Ca2+/H+ antiporter, TMEM165/GDT1 family